MRVYVCLGAIQHQLEQVEHCVGVLWPRCAHRAVHGATPGVASRLWAGPWAAEATGSTAGSDADTRRVSMPFPGHYG